MSLKQPFTDLQIKKSAFARQIGGSGSVKRPPDPV